MADAEFTKRCPRCEAIKPHTDFYRSAKSKDGRAGYCISCAKEKAVEWQKANPEKKAASDKKQNAKPERFEKMQARRRKAYEADPAGSLKKLADWAVLNRNKLHESRQAWKKANTEKVAAAQKRYHDKPEWRAIAALRHQVNWAIKRADDAGLTRDGCINRLQWQAVLERFGHSCCYCATDGKLTLEHLTPLSRGGDNAVGNIAPACAPCNRRKWHRSLEEFAPEKAKWIRATASLIK